MSASSSPAKKRARPLSPHLQVYRLPLTALMSISHRITGAALIGGTLIVAGFLISAALGPEAYNLAMGMALSMPGQIALFLWSAALYYHMCNGIRHMFWDMGFLLSLKKAQAANFVVLLCALGLTAATWLCTCKGVF